MVKDDDAFTISNLASSAKGRVFGALALEH